jgi:dTMP kinase
MINEQQEREFALDLKSKLAGKFIVFDGPDGSGKGTQLRMLAERLSGEGLEVVCARDPGGTTIGDRIRSVLLDYDLSEMDVRC